MRRWAPAVGLAALAGYAGRRAYRRGGFRADPFQAHTARERRLGRLVRRPLEGRKTIHADRPMGRRAIEVDPEADYAASRSLNLRVVGPATERTVLMPAEVPGGFNRGLWSQIRTTIVQTETTTADQAWARFLTARDRFQKFNPKWSEARTGRGEFPALPGEERGKADVGGWAMRKSAEREARKEAAVDRYLDWAYTQRFKFAGIRPEMSLADLWYTVTHAVKQEQMAPAARLNRTLIPGNWPKTGRKQPDVGINSSSKKLLAFLGESEKVKKGKGRGYATFVSYMSPSMEAGYNVCRFASKGCRQACLGFSSGQLRGLQMMARRIRRTLWFLLFRDSFLHKLTQEIAKATAEAAAEGYTPVFRLNGSTDIEWELPENGAIPALFPQFEFYDYTKLPLRDRRLAVEGTKAGIMKYRLTFSFSDTNKAAEWSQEYLSQGVNVAVVVGLVNNFKATDKRRRHHINAAKAFIRQANRSRTALGFKAIDGDKDDLRFLDYIEAAKLYGVEPGQPHPGCWVVLYAKGAPAARDRTGFVVRVTAKGVPVDPRFRRARLPPASGANRRGYRDAREMINWYEQSINNNCP